MSKSEEGAGAAEEVIADRESRVIFALDTASTSFRELRAVMLDRTEKFERVLRRLAVMAGIQLVSTILLVILTIGLLNVISTVNNVTNPKGKFARDQAVRTVDLLQRLSVENDCRGRRADAGMPAPDPARPFSCPAQTPKEVYPGE